MFEYLIFIIVLRNLLFLSTLRFVWCGDSEHVVRMNGTFREEERYVCANFGNTVEIGPVMRVCSLWRTLLWSSLAFLLCGSQE